MTAILLAVLCSTVPQEPGPSAWWVFLTDRGSGYEARIEAFRDSLDPASLDRRLEAGLPCGADSFDLEPWPRYVGEIESILGPGRVRTRSRFLNAVSVDASESEARELLLLPFVSGIRPVATSVYEPPDSSFRAAGGMSDSQLEQAGVALLLERGWTGSGITVGILDTGFDLEHPALASVDVIAQYDFINDDGYTGWEPGDPGGQAAHGTATLSVAGGLEPGVFSGAAPGASFALAKTEDISGEYQGEEDYWIEGLEWLDLQGASLVSSSLGYIDWYSYSDMDGNTALTTIAADLAASRGMPVVNAIGNEGPADGTLIAPADGDSVFAVGGVDALGSPASFASRGPTWDGRIKPDFCARAVGVIVAQDGGTGYHPANGTSFAAPMVSGAAALLLEAHPEWTSMDALEALRATASQASSPDCALGWGVIDAAAAFMYRSVTGLVRRSDTGAPIPGRPLALSIGGDVFQITSGPSGWFAFCPDATGAFTITGSGGEGTVREVTGFLGDSGVETTVYVDFEPRGLPPSAFPVPSLGGVWFGFDLEAVSDVILTIMPLEGGEIAEIRRSGLPPGPYRAPVEGGAIYWDGCSSDGEPAASGPYFALLDTGGEVTVLKIALVR